MMMWEAINKRHCEIFARKSWQSMAEKSFGSVDLRKDDTGEIK